MHRNRTRALAKENPDESAQWLQKLAGCYLQQGKNTEALDTIKKGIAAAVLPRDGQVLSLLKKDLVSQYPRAGDWRNAAPLCQSLQQANAGSASQSFLDLGRLYYKQGMLDDAIAVTKQGLASVVLPDDRDVLKLLKSALAFYYVESKNWDAASPLYGELLAEYPEDKAQWYREQAIFFDRQGDYYDAIDVAKKGIAACVLPKDGDMLKILTSSLGFYYEAIKDWQNATNVYVGLQNDYPEDNAQWLQELGRCYRLQGDYKKAESLLAEGVADVQSSASPELIKSLKIEQCLAYSEAGDWDNALPLNRDLITDYPENAAWLLGTLSGSYYLKGDYNNAIIAYTDQIARFPDYIGSKAAQACVAECTFLLGQRDAAIASLDKLQTESKDPYTLAAAILTEGYLNMLEHNYTRAGVLLNQVISQYPTSYQAEQAQVFIGLLMIQQNHIGEAQVWFGNLAKADPTNDEWQFYGAYCLFRENNWAGARDAFQSIRSTFTEGKCLAENGFLLAECLVQLGDKADAITVYAEVVDKFPGTVWARLASGRLAGLQGSVNPAAASGPVGKLTGGKAE